MEQEKQRIIQEFVPGKQVTLAHVIANPDSSLYKKLGVIGKLKTFFEKYFGIGGSASFTEEQKPFAYNMSSEPALMVAEDKAPYNTK